MARNDKVPFRREITITENGYVGTNSGFFVGDIMSLHVNTENNKDSILVEGKSSVIGNWETLYRGYETKDIDIKAWEHIRVSVTLGIGYTSSKIVLFGYELPIDKDIQITHPTDNNLRIELQNNDNLEAIKLELEKLNTYMAIITGEKI